MKFISLKRSNKKQTNRLRSVFVLFILSGLTFTSCQEEELPAPIVEKLYKTYGSIGDEIGIGGDNFGTNAAEIEVRFNGVLAEIKTVGEYRIDAIVPEGASSGFVTITKAGKVAESSEIFYVRSWKKITDLPSAIANNQNNPPPTFFTACNGKLYAGLGSFNSEIWEYTPSTKAWVKKTTAPIEEPQMTAHFVLNNKIYFLFQLSNAGYVRDFFEYDPAVNTWTRKADFPVTGPPLSKTGFSVGGKGYMLMGSGSSKELHVYNPTTNLWGRLSDFPGTFRSSFTIYQTESNVYVGGGSVGSTYFKDHWKYDATLDTWQQQSDLPEAGLNPALFDLGGVLYYGFGYTGATFSKNFWSNSGSQWSDFPQHNFTLEGYQAVDGGKGYRCDYISIWEFDPSVH